MAKQQKAGVVWVWKWKGLFYLSPDKPKWDDRPSWWAARFQQGLERCVAVGVLRLTGLRHPYAYLVDLLKAIRGEPFILRTLKPPKGK